MTIDAKSLIPLRDNVFVCDLDSGMKKTASGIILMDDNMRDSGIRPRWAKVFAVGPEVEDLAPGDWVLVSHGRWTNGMDFTHDGEDIKLWRIEYPDSVLLVTDSDPRDTVTVKF